jgi:hypothetical protein
VSYVDAGYAAALGICFLYGLGLFLRRRRWERALAVMERTPEEDGAPPAEQP